MTLINKHLITALGFISLLAISFVSQAAENPFGMTDATNSMQVAGDQAAKCSEGKCGKCGKMKMEGKLDGATQRNAVKGKCGEGKCGKMKADGKLNTTVKQNALKGKCGKCGKMKMESKINATARQNAVRQNAVEQNTVRENAVRQNAVQNKCGKCGKCGKVK